MVHIIAIALLIVTLTSAVAASAGTPGASAVIQEDFTSVNGWRGPIYKYLDSTIGDAFIRHGVLTIVRNPGGKYHSLSMEKEFDINFSPGTVIEMRFRLEEPLLGADMYTTVILDEKILVQMGINGEQHWKMFANCERKEWDDEFFFGSDLIRGSGKKKHDFRVALPETLAGKIRYRDWHVFSVKYDVKRDEKRIRLFVDGQEITYRCLDSRFPEGVIDNRVVDDFLPKPGPNKLRISLGIMGDGDLYGDKSVHEGAGVRWLHAFADNTPAIPSSDEPTAAVKKPSRMFWDWVRVQTGE